MTADSEQAQGFVIDVQVTSSTSRMTLAFSAFLISSGRSLCSAMSSRALSRAARASFSLGLSARASSLAILSLMLVAMVSYLQFGMWSP